MTDFCWNLKDIWELIKEAHELTLDVGVLLYQLDAIYHLPNNDEIYKPSCDRIEILEYFVKDIYEINENLRCIIILETYKMPKEKLRFSIIHCNYNCTLTKDEILFVSKTHLALTSSMNSEITQTQNY